MASQTRSALADKKMVGRAIKDSFIKLDPKIQKENPVMLMATFRLYSQRFCG